MANKTPSKIATDALLRAFEKAAHGKARRKGLRISQTADLTKATFHSYECSFEVQISDAGVFCLLYPRRVNLSGICFCSLYVDFDETKINPSEHGKFANVMTSDFTALFTSVFNTPYAWEGCIPKEENLACFLTDSQWLNKKQDAPVALHYPNQTMNSGKTPLANLIGLQDGYNHCFWFEPDKKAAEITFRKALSLENSSNENAIWLMDDCAVVRKLADQC